MNVGPAFFGATSVAAAIRARVQLRFEASPGLLADEGLAASTWSDPNATFTQTSVLVKEGTKNGSFVATGSSNPTCYIETTATSANCINGTHDGAMGGWFNMNGAGGYIAGVRNVSPYGAADTGVCFYLGSATNDIVIAWGNGSSVLTTAYGPTDRRGTTVHLWVEQFSVAATPKMFFYINGSLVNTGGTTTGGSIPIQTGAKLRVGDCLGPSSATCAINEVDSFQVFDFSLYSGASSFTPPGLAL